MRAEWKESLSVHFNLIDDQHKELINHVNALLSAMAEGKGRDRLTQVLQFIQDYVVVHFGTEEGLMKKYNYPGYELHKAEHEKLVAEFLEKKEKLSAAAVTSADVIKTYNWLTGWVINHIMTTDIKLGPFLKEKVK